MNFNWHDLEDGFQKWMIVTLISGSSLKDEEFDKFDEINKATDGFKNVDLEISINGIPIKADYFVNQVHENMKWYAAQYANEKVADAVNDFNQKVYDIQEVMKEAAQKILENAGIEVIERFW